MTIQDPSHGLRFTTVSQPAPGDWLEVEYEKSDWVEERLVEILRNGVEVLAQDVSCFPVQAAAIRWLTSSQYVSTRMGLKPSAATVAPAAKTAEAPAATEEQPPAATSAAAAAAAA